jgi:hypothetical protein
MGNNMNVEKSNELVEHIEKAWNRFKIARAGGSRRDFQTYEVVLSELIKAVHELLLNHERRLNAIEKSEHKD